MEIRSHYFPVFTRAGFEYILKQIEPRKNDEKILIPVIHISAHGAKDCFGLTDGETINWGDFRHLLAPVNRKCLGNTDTLHVRLFRFQGR